MSTQRARHLCFVGFTCLVLGACAPPAQPPPVGGDKKGKGKSEEAPAPTPRRSGDEDEEEGGSIEGLSSFQATAGYRPLPKRPELVLAEDVQRALLSVARAGCDGKTLEQAPELKAPEARAPIIGVLYDDDGTRVRSHREEDAQDLRATAHAVGRALCARGGTDGFIHLLVVTRQIHVLNFGIKGLFDNKVFEPQVTGAIYNYGGRRFELDPLEQLERNMGAGDARTALARGVGLDASQVPNKVDLTMEFYRTAHVGERYPDKQATRFFRGHRAFSHEELTHQELEARLKLIGQWYKNNVEDGEVTYQYLPSRRTYQNNERTMIRSTMSTWILNRLAFYLDDKELQSKGNDVIEHYFERYFNMRESKQKGRIIPSAKALANGNTVDARWTVASFIAAACNERADKSRFKDEMELLMTWAASHQRDDGVIWSPNGGEQYFMPGQFLLPVTYFYRDTKDEKYKAIFERAFAVYAPSLYDTMEFGPAWHAPYAPAWFTQPVAQMYLITGNDAYKDLVFAINDRVLLAYETNARHQVYPDYDGMLAPKPLSYGNNSITAASLEALTDAAIVAKKAGDLERFKRYQHVIRRATAFLLRLQYLPENTYYMKDRHKVIGGFKNDMVNTRSWMDSVWHLTSAFIKIQQHKLLE